MGLRCVLRRVLRIVALRLALRGVLCVVAPRCVRVALVCVALRFGSMAQEKDPKTYRKSTRNRPQIGQK